MYYSTYEVEKIISTTNDLAKAALTSMAKEKLTMQERVNNPLQLDVDEWYRVMGSNPNLTESEAYELLLKKNVNSRTDL